MKKFYSFLVIALFAGTSVMAQPSLQKLQDNLELQRTANPAQAQPQFSRSNATQASLLFAANTPSLRQADAAQWLSQQLGFRQGVDVLNTDKNITLKDNFSVSKFHQYYKGVKVEHGVANIAGKNGNATAFQLEFYSIPDDFKTNPTIPEATALQQAMQFTHATHFVWQGYTGNNPSYQLPKGQLVIIRNYEDDSTVCLAWKFDIYADDIAERSLIYVNAHTGKVVLSNPVTKHTNSYGFADTKYSGGQSITTDNAGLTPGRPYKLQEVRNGHFLGTFNYQRRNATPANDNLAVEFSDNDNNWSAAEYNNSNQDNAALDVHFNMEIVSDYWNEIHLRSGWDGYGAQLVGMVHVTRKGAPMENAFWDGKYLYFGDGAPQPPLVHGLPKTSLDVIAHEVGHAITDATSELVYRWESGALNEGFSDIWAACITNYAKIRNSSLSSELTWRIGEKCFNPDDALRPGLRDMQKPILFLQPAAYKDNFWEPESNYQVCPIEDSTNDHCGVHTNSGVLNRWFYLITQGDMGTDPQGNPYDLVGQGFDVTQKILYLTSILMPPNASYATARNVSAVAATTLYSSAYADIMKAAWKAVGVDTSIYDMSNVPAFTTNNFTTIAVGSQGYVWAGTNYNGLYMNNGTTWIKRSEITNVRINDIKADRSGGIWVAQSGTQASGSAATAGGVNYFATPTAAQVFYTKNTVPYNLPSRNARSLYIDTTWLNDGTNPKVWVATNSYIFNGSSASGMLGQGLYNSAPAFRSVNAGLNIGSNTAGFQTVGGNKNEVWAFTQANYGVNQLLVYSTTTNAFIYSYDHNNVPTIPSGFLARAIYCDAKNRFWIGLATGGVLVYDEHQQWHLINFPLMFPTGSQVNFNAITGDKYGDVYIGTTAGLVFFDHGIGQIDRIDNPDYYRRILTGGGLPSNNVNAIAYDTLRYKLWIATDAGIVKWEPLCIGNSCGFKRNGLNAESATVSSGSWSNPAIWSTGMVPDSTTNVSIEDTILVDVNAKCRSLSILPPGKVQVSPGLNITIYQDDRPIIYGRKSKARKKAQ